MGGVTNYYDFPYPTGTDRVADGDNAIQALADALDAFLGGANVGATYEATVTAHLEGTYAQRRGGVQILRIGFRSISAAPIAPGSKLFTLPVGFRPDAHVRFLAKDVNSQAPLSLTLYIDGTCFTEQNIAVAAQYAGIVSYPASNPP